MRLFSTVVFAVLVHAAFGHAAFADTIHLKNGRILYGQEAREEDGKIVYQRGENTYAIPKAMVDRIEHSSEPLPATSEPAGPAATGRVPDPQKAAQAVEDAQGFALTGSVPGIEAAADVVRNNRVNPDAIAALERAGKNESIGAAYFLAGRYEYEHGDRERARYYLDRAAMQLPENPTVLNLYATVLVQLGRATEAIRIAERSTRLAPSNPEGLFVLGFAYYSGNRTEDAIPVLKQVMEMRPHETARRLLAKAEKEASTEAQFQRSETGHFQLRYEGNSMPGLLRQQIEQSLEESYNELVSELGIAPANTIPVSLYTNQAFFDVTEAPAWTGALNDGKIRIPIQGVQQVTPQLRRVLKHELAHSFIDQAARGRCPQWLNEGIAQLVEPRSIGARGPRLAQLYQEHRQIPLSTLEKSFMSFSTNEAMLVYDQTLAVAEYIRDTYTLGELRSILERLAEGGTVESALMSTIHCDYAQLDEELTRYLSRRFGR